MIGLSPLSAGHRRRFQPTCVRPSTGSYPRFSLPTDSSPGFASAARDSSRPVKARFRSGSLSVNLAPRQRLAGSFYKRHAVTTESCSDCSWAHGFRYCFTPLPGCFSPFPHGTMRYRSISVFCLGGWSPLLPTGFLVSRGTLVPSVPLPLSLTWLSHPAALLPRSFSWIPRSYDGPQPRKSFLLRFGLLPRSLAATGGISFDYFSSGYLDVSVRLVPSHTHRHG